MRDMALINMICGDPTVLRHIRQWIGVGTSDAAGEAGLKSTLDAVRIVYVAVLERLWTSIGRMRCSGSSSFCTTRPTGRRCYNVDLDVFENLRTCRSIASVAPSTTWPSGVLTETIPVSTVLLVLSAVRHGAPL
ncbi:hypothetical protein BV898_10508 [Hypsibius exemplaris]|nr:hypothetical protein BV898_10508 [Hypsibius exemplaris]